MGLLLTITRLARKLTMWQVLAQQFLFFTSMVPPVNTLFKLLFIQQNTYCSLSSLNEWHHEILPVGIVPAMRKNAVDRNTFEFVLLSDDAKVPRKATLGSAGFDGADIWRRSMIQLDDAQTTVKIPLDLSISPPDGTYTRTAARSSLATRHQIICPADVIDPDYTGCIHMCLTNLSDRDYTVQKHERIGSLIFEYYCNRSKGKMTKLLKGTQRGSKGFGSSGKFWTYRH